MSGVWTFRRLGCRFFESPVGRVSHILHCLLLMGDDSQRGLALGTWVLCSPLRRSCSPLQGFCHDSCMILCGPCS